MYPELMSSKQTPWNKCLILRPSVHQPQNKQAIIRGAKNWDYKASGEPGTLSAGQHCRTKPQKLHESMKNSKFPSFQSASAAERSHPGSIFPPDAMFPSGFRTLISSTTLLNSGLFLPRALQFLAFKTTACILLRTTTKVTMFETQGNTNSSQTIYESASMFFWCPVLCE